MASAWLDAAWAISQSILGRSSLITGICQGHGWIEAPPYPSQGRFDFMLACDNLESRKLHHILRLSRHGAELRPAAYMCISSLSLYPWRKTVSHNICEHSCERIIPHNPTTPWRTVTLLCCVVHNILDPTLHTSRTHHIGPRDSQSEPQMSVALNLNILQGWQSTIE